MPKRQYLEVSCTDIGPGCGAMFRVASEAELMEIGAMHARITHGHPQVPPELAERVRAATKTVEVDVMEA